MPELKLTDLPTACQPSVPIADPVLKLIYEDVQETTKTLKLSFQSLSSTASTILLSSLILLGLEMVNIYLPSNKTNIETVGHILVLFGVLFTALIAVQSLKTKSVVCYIYPATQVEKGIPTNENLWRKTIILQQDKYIKSYESRIAAKAQLNRVSIYILSATIVLFVSTILVDSLNLVF